ncbi:MAG: hypothetical protein HY911_04230 [Desulfobacterales bacterium]|nr:hypothetical protein [Desulfobacterales bacterium]
MAATLQVGGQQQPATVQPSHTESVQQQTQALTEQIQQIQQELRQAQKERQQLQEDLQALLSAKQTPPAQNDAESTARYQKNSGAWQTQMGALTARISQVSPGRTGA